MLNDEDCGFPASPHIHHMPGSKIDTVQISDNSYVQHLHHNEFITLYSAVIQHKSHRVTIQQCQPGP